MDENSELRINIWKSLTKKDKKALGVFFFIYMVIVFWGVLESDKWGLGIAIISVDIISLLLVSSIPFFAWIIDKWKIEASIIICAEFFGMTAILMVHRYYPDQIVVGWFFTMIVVKIFSVALTKRKRITCEFWMPILCTVVGLVAMLLFNKDARVVNDGASYWYMADSIIGAVLSSVIIRKVDRKRVEG